MILTILEMNKRIKKKKIQKKQEEKRPDSFKFLSPEIKTDCEQTLVSRNLLFHALKLSNLIFFDGLYYRIPRIMNNPWADKETLIEASEETLIQLRKLKSLTSEGFYPFYLDGNSEYGIFGRAIMDLEPETLLCEYTGDVVINREYAFNYESDDSFTLLTTGSTKTSLDIVPITHSNAARFLLSVGRKTKKHQNVRFKIKNNLNYFILGKILSDFSVW